MALTIRDLPEEDIERFKSLTGKVTTAGALVEAARIGVTTTDKLKKAEQRIAAMELQLRTYQQSISRLNQACIQVAELATQTDLFEN